LKVTYSIAHHTHGPTNNTYQKHLWQLISQTLSTKSLLVPQYNIPGRLSFFFFFSLLRGDCECRGWYDCPQSALRPHTGVTQCAIKPQMYANQSVNGWCVTLPEAGVYCVGGTLLPYVYSARLRLFRFTRHRPSVHDAHSCQVTQWPARPS